MQLNCPSLWPSGIGAHLRRNRLWVRFLAVSDIYPMFIEPIRLLGSLRGSLGTTNDTLLDTTWHKNCVEKNWIYISGAVADGATESVATHSSRLQPSIIWKFQLQPWCSAVPLYDPERIETKTQVSFETTSSLVLVYVHLSCIHTFIEF